MGFAIEWLAVRNTTPDAVCSELGLERTGQWEDVPESPIVGAQLPTGWYLVWSNRFRSPFYLASLQSLSSRELVVTCTVEEHVMCSLVEGWKDGREAWSIYHDAQDGIGHLAAKGDLPSVYGDIRDRLMAKLEAAGGTKSDVDYVFDIPVEVAEALTGFCYNKDIEGMGEDPFEVLNDPRPTGVKWLVWKVRSMFGLG